MKARSFPVPEYAQIKSESLTLLKWLTELCFLTLDQGDPIAMTLDGLPKVTFFLALLLCPVQVSLGNKSLPLRCDKCNLGSV